MDPNDGDNTQNHGDNTRKDGDNTPNNNKGERREFSTWLQIKEAVADSESHQLSPPVLQCGICLDYNILTPFTPPDKVATAFQGVILFCGHMFCEECYTEAIKVLKLRCPLCREKLEHPTSLWGESCPHPIAYYRLGNKPPLRVPVTLTEAHAWGVDPKIRIAGESWDSLSPEDKKRVPIPLHCRECRTERAEGLAEEFRRYGRVWERQPEAEVWRQLKRKNLWTTREIECAIPPTGKHIIVYDKHDYKAFILHHLQEQLHLENDTWGGLAPAHPGNFDDVSRLAIETSIRETGKTPAQLRKEAEEKLELEIQERQRNTASWW